MNTWQRFAFKKKEKKILVIPSIQQSCQNPFPQKGLASPGTGRSPHSWKDLRALWTWHLGTRVSGGLSSAGECLDLKGLFPPQGFRENSQSQGITDLQLQLQVVGRASSAITQLRHPDPEQGQAVTLQEGLEAGLRVRVLERQMWEQSESSRQKHGKLLHWKHGQSHGRARTRHLSRSKLI